MDAVMPSCDRCLWMHRAKDHLECRASAPPALTVDKSLVWPVARWPIVCPKDWCRQWRLDEETNDGR